MKFQDITEAKDKWMPGIDGESNHFGFQDEKNAGLAAVAMARADFNFRMQFEIGFYYFYFKDASSAKKALKVAEKVIDSSKEPE